MPRYGENWTRDELILAFSLYSEIPFGKIHMGNPKVLEGASNKLHVGPGNLVSQAEKMRRLGAKASKTLPVQLVEQAIESDVGHPALPSIVEIRNPANPVPEEGSR